MASEKIIQKLENLPKNPGVYFHKNAAGDIIYIGKAAVLRNRVRQYFQKSRVRDPKTDALVAEIADTDWIETESEIDALFLEAELIRRYMPPYNILLRDDKSLSFVRIDIKSEHPTVSITRRPLDDGAEYFGPYISGFAVKRALRYLRRIFPYAVRKNEATMGSRLYEQMGLDPGLDSGRTSLSAYRSNLRRLMQYLRGEKETLMKGLEKDMNRLAKAGEYEQAAKVRDQLFALRDLNKQIIFSDKEFLDISKDMGLSSLAAVLGLEKPPRRIEGYDISHMQGTDTVASMVVFHSGLPDKASYRKFKMRLPGNDDFAHMHEVLTRRLGEKHAKDWPLPDLFLIDGGKGQLGAAVRALEERSIQRPAIGLAKQYEEIIVSKSWPHVFPAHQAVLSLGGTITETDDYVSINLPDKSDVVKLLQRIRDESHRFAVSYHSVLKRSRQTKSWLEEVPGIGPKTKKALLRSFGSAKGVEQARKDELISILGEAKAGILLQYVRAKKKGSI